MYTDLAGDICFPGALGKLLPGLDKNQNSFIVQDQELLPDSSACLENKLLSVVAAGVGVDPGKPHVLAVVASVEDPRARPDQRAEQQDGEKHCQPCKPALQQALREGIVK